MSFRGSILILAVVICLARPVSAQKDFTRYVDPFIGTGGHGHTFPGATWPFGMVQLSPDTRLTGWDGCSGYHYSDTIIYGFSHTHLSGTGISDYGDILLMPTVGEVFLTAMNPAQPGDPANGYASRFKHENETAKPGYYAVKLDDENILIELTTTRRAGFHRYTYPTTNKANIILDLAHRDKVVASYVRITGGNTFVGWRRSEGWARNQIVYFAGEFSRGFEDWGVGVDGRKQSQSQEVRGTNLQAYFTFEADPKHPVMVKVGISSVSIAGAVKNLWTELPGWDFAKAKADAARAWNVELGKIQVTGGTESQQKNFYTALYHTMLAPNLFMDVDGQYRGRDFNNHRAAGFENYTVFSLWDTFRATHPLYTIIDQKRTADFINTFISQYEQGGRLPVWELAANETDTMIGYHAVSVIADAIAKNIQGFDRDKAFAAMKHSAELKHFGLDSYQSQGFINLEDERESVSRTLEYAYDDWCIAQTARALGRSDDYQRYIARAQYYKNVFDSTTGFMRPRTNGGWLRTFDPREVDFNFTEANSWQYTFFVPHDVSGLIQLMGGKHKFNDKLDAMFEAESKTTGREQADITGLVGQYAHGNEPSHHVAYLFNYAGWPWKTQSRVRQIMDRFYQPTPDGLIGNEDCGQMSAWFVLSAAGFYSVTPGAEIYAIGTPLFPELRFNLENGKAFVIKANGVSEKNFYIQSAKLNGQTYRKSYLSHGDLMAGGELVFEMGAIPNADWGAGENDVPISRITDHELTPTPLILAESKTFRNKLRIELRSIGGNAQVHYTTDESEPGPASPKYVRPFFIASDTVIKAVSISDKNGRSLIATGRFHRVPHNWTIKLVSKYSPQYTGGGDLALIDGIRGTTNWSGGGWQGYQGQDFVAVVDLGKHQRVSKVGAGFLQDIGSWIWMPSHVDFEVSTNGRVYHSVASIPNDVSEKQYGVLMKDFQKQIAPQKARYVRIRARTFGKIPSWHPGHNGDAWIFVDEIKIE